MTNLKNSIPKNAEKVFEGKLYDVWQWRQEMYDGSLKVFEKIEKKACDVAIIAFVGDKILVQNQEQPHREPFISLPGGMIDFGESELSAAKKELFEETGMSSDDLRFWKVFQSQFSSIVRNFYYFIAKNCFKTGDLNLDNGEKITNKLISFDEFLELSENESFRNFEIKNFLFEMRLDEGRRGEFLRSIV